MPIKYGEITIMHNKEETSVISTLLSWLSYEVEPPPKSKIVLLFEDGEICDVNDTLKDFNFIFTTSVISINPVFFEKKTTNKECNNVYFHKTLIKNDKGYESLDFYPLFSQYTKYDFSKCVPSSYNNIYYHLKCRSTTFKPEVFGIIRIKSSETMPRFIVAYDCDEFTREEVIYLINYILNPLNRQNETTKT